MYTINENGDRVYTLKVNSKDNYIFYLLEVMTCWFSRNVLRMVAPLCLLTQHAFRRRISTPVKGSPSRSVLDSSSPRNLNPST